MAKNEVLVHIDDRQISDLKRSNHQQFLKVSAEIDKVKKEIVRLNNRLGEISRFVEKISVNFDEENGVEGCSYEAENDEK